MKPVVLVQDNGPIHVSKLTLKALEERKHWLTVEWLPKYAPELNDIEVVWRDLKAHHLAHQTFTDVAVSRSRHPYSRRGLEQRAMPRSVGQPEESPALNGLVFLSPCRRKRDVGAAVSNGDRI